MVEKFIAQEEQECRERTEMQIQHYRTRFLVDLGYAIGACLFEIFVLIMIPPSQFVWYFRLPFLLVVLVGMYLAFNAGHDHACLKDLRAKLRRLKGEEATPISTSS